MRDEAPEQAILDFYSYPPIGGDDWRYAFETARVRGIEMHLLSRAILLDMANASSFAQAADLLSATEYLLSSTSRARGQMEQLLGERRAAARQLFSVLCLDRPIVELFRTRDDFANLRLVLRRTLTEKPVAADYSDEGNFPPELFEQVFEEQNYELVPDYMQQAAESAVLAYYQDKDIRRIDYAIDKAQAHYNLTTAHRLESIFLLNLFRIQIDLTNIRTILRLKFTESEQRNVLLDGGFVARDRLEKALELGYEQLGSLFFVTPYYRLVETGSAYLAAEKSFLKLEQQCDEYLAGFLKTTITITAGPQPIIAYLLTKEQEIRTVRLILTAKRNHLDTKLILDRIS